MQSKEHTELGKEFEQLRDTGNRSLNKTEAKSKTK